MISLIYRISFSVKIEQTSRERATEKQEFSKDLANVLMVKRFFLGYRAV